MRITYAFTLVFAISACSNSEKATSTADSTAATTVTPVALTTPAVEQEQPSPEVPTVYAVADSVDSVFYFSGISGADTLYNILARNHAVGNTRPREFRLDIVSNNVMDLQNPAGEAKFISAWITVQVLVSDSINSYGNGLVGENQILAFFDASNNMKLVAHQDFGQATDENNSPRYELGYNKQLIAGAGDMITVHSTIFTDTDQYGTHETGTDKAISWYALSGGEIVEIATVVTESDHTRSEDRYSFNDVSTTEYEFKTVKSRKLPDILLTTRTSTGIVDGTDESQNTTILIFDGKGYQEKSN